MSKYSSYILFLLITIFVVILAANNFGPMASLQQSINDFVCRVSVSDETKPNIALVKIDGLAQEEFGSWPWNHDRIADLVAAVATAEAKSIMVTFELAEDAVQDSSGHTAILAQQLSWIETAVLPYDIALSTFRGNRTNNPDHLFEYSLTVENPLGLLDESSSLHARKVFFPAEKLMVNDPKLGFEYIMPDYDRTLRHQSMLVDYEGYYYPSLPLLAAAVYRGVPADQIRVIENQIIDLGGQIDIPINGQSEFFIKFSEDNSFVSYSAAEILGENFDFSQLKDKLVVLCVDDYSITQYFRTPTSEETPDYVIKATVAENIINGNILTPHNNSPLTDMLILLVLGAICAYFLPQINMFYRMIILGCALMILTNINYFLISSFDIIANTVFVGLELILFMIASPLLESSLITGNVDSKSKDKKRSLPKVKIDPAKLDKEEIPLREITSSEFDPENQQTAMLSDSSENFPDPQAISLDDSSKTSVISDSAEVVEDDRTSALDSDKVSAQDLDPYDSDGIDLLDVTPKPLTKATTTDSGGYPATELKNLGRYQILGTLGKGAMGHVYKGVDPAINRPVALKTIRLDFVNDPQEMEELKERLFREAQAAGKLSHPNIVTIYDVGSEGHLQYIAMEYLEGCTLEDLIKKKTKFNYRIISQIIIQMCHALEYAHDRGIVHRDIKPANIMILADYTVKIMDYGIARVDSSSMTKTGIAMGTPNYISPEQLQGKEIDSRADLFSLGVVMYELLLGRRPFKGENITSLIYSILNTEPEKPSTINPQVPLLMDHIISKALKKSPSDRYQKANEIISDLADFVESFAAKR